MKQSKFYLTKIVISNSTNLDKTITITSDVVFYDIIEATKYLDQSVKKLKDLGLVVQSQNVDHVYTPSISYASWSLVE